MRFIDKLAKCELTYGDNRIICAAVPMELYTCEILTEAKDDSRWPTNCSNCGAPLHSGRCEYCGTEYSSIRQNEIGERREEQ